MENTHGIPGDFEGLQSDNYPLEGPIGCLNALKILAGGTAAVAIVVYLILS